jgi:hypothetical protein
MTPSSQFDEIVQELLGEVISRMVVRRWSEFDALYARASEICDRYEVTRSPEIQTPAGFPFNDRPPAIVSIAS